MTGIEVIRSYNINDRKVVLKNHPSASVAANESFKWEHVL